VIGGIISFYREIFESTPGEYSNIFKIVQVITCFYYIFEILSLVQLVSLWFYIVDDGS